MLPAIFITEQLWNDAVDLAIEIRNVYHFRSVIQCQGSQETTDEEYNRLMHMDKMASEHLEKCYKKHDIGKDELLDFVQMLMGLSELISWRQITEMRKDVVGLLYTPTYNYLTCFKK